MSVTVLLVIVGTAITWAFQTGRAIELVRETILTELHDRCEVTGELQKLTVDPLRREIVLRSLKIWIAAVSRLLSVDSAQVQVAFWPLVYGRFQLARVALLRPKADIRIRDGHMVDLPPCVEPAEGSGAPINLGVSALTVERGRFSLEVDDVLSTELHDIEVQLATRSGGGTSLGIAVDDSELMLRGHPLTVSTFRLEGRIEGLLARPRAVVVDTLNVRFIPRATRLSKSSEARGSTCWARPMRRSSKC